VSQFENGLFLMLDRYCLTLYMANKQDVNQYAKSIVDQLTDPEAREQQQSDKNPAAVALGRLGGLKGGKARADGLTPERRKEIALKAAAKRWGK